MHCAIDKSVFLNELDFLSPALRDRPVQPPVLSMNVQDDKLTVAAYDGRIDLRSSVPVSDARPGACSTRGGIVRSMAQLLPKGTVRLGLVKGNHLHMAWPDGSASFPHVAKWLLRPVTAAPIIDLAIPVAALADMLTVVKFAVADNDYSNRIPGVLLEVDADGTLRIVATDGYSLAVVERPAPDAVEPGAPSQSLIMPSSSVAVIRTMLAGKSVRLMVAGDDLQVTCGSRQLTMRAAVGAFPAYTAIIPKVTGHGATMHAADLSATVNRVLLGGDDEFGQVSLAFTTDTVQVSSADSSEALSCNYTGERYAVKFSAKKLRALLGGFKADRITMFTENSKHPQMFQPAGNDRTRMILAPINK